MNGTKKQQPITVTDYSIVDPDGGIAYLFYMPQANTKVGATFAPGASAQNAPTNAAGKSVGVGAGFAMTYSNVTVTAGIGNNRSVIAKTLDIRADADQRVTTSGVAGTDPLDTSNAVSNQNGQASAAATQTQKDISLDAAAAVTVAKNTIRTYIGENTDVTITGGNDVEAVEDDPSTHTVDETQKVAFNMAATQTGRTLTKSSSFAAGQKTAVGASVTVNVVESDVRALMQGNVTASGAARIAAITKDRDDSQALATAMGADIDRYLNRFSSGTATTQNTANRLLILRVSAERSSHCEGCT